MRKSKIWTLAVLMGISFLTLLYLQMRYFGEVIQIRKQQFNESVSRSLYQASKNLEIAETNERLQKGLLKDLKDSLYIINNQEPTIEPFEMSDNCLKDIRNPKLIEEYNHEKASEKIKNELRKKITNAFLYQKGILNDVIYSIFYKPSNKPILERIKNLDTELKSDLKNNGININYHYCVTNIDGDTIYKCPDFQPGEKNATYRQILFPTDSRCNISILYINFPNLKSLVFSSVKFMIPAILFTLGLLVMFIITIYFIFKQKKVAEMKNDFINNMTHEFKTPIATISLASQMLQDPGITKSAGMMKHVSNVISDETKRLRFQVEKVLQMSMFDKKAGTYKRKELDLNKLIEDVVNTFKLRVESGNGTITTNLKAEKTNVFADEMHMTNVIFNLLDNALKYKKTDEDLNITIESYNHGNKITISICDNGIGIAKDDIKKIFGRFFRAHTGNRHDVKGFGLGLAYVKTIIDFHKGTIKAESEIGKGTCFKITLPLLD